MMRLHIQNLPDDRRFAVTPAQWEAAARRAPEAAAGVVPSFADDERGFRDGARDAEAMLCFTRDAPRLTAPGALLGAAPGLRLLSFTSAGLDKLAPFSWLPPGVTLLNNGGTHADKAGEYGIMAILMIRNHVPAFAHAMRGGHWEPRFASTLAGTTLGVLGMGTLGAAVARRARQFGMRVLGLRGEARPHADADEHFGEADLPVVLPRCDFLVLACPLTPRTRGLISRDMLERLPRGAGVVNIARGAVWDADAACDLLDGGHLGGCVTDVAAVEPLPPGDRQWHTPGMFVTPHMSSDDPATYNDRTLDILLRNIAAHRDGAPLPNRVDPARGY